MGVWERAAGIAAGHPDTARAGLEILERGGNAADAAIAATLASCVAETVMSGLASGGHAIWWDGETRRALLLDCFVAVPGLGPARAASPLTEIEIPFGSQPVPYAVGIASCAVPGLPAGLGELWRRFGSLPWRCLVEPALRLAGEGTRLPPAHAACLRMLEPVMTMRQGADLYAPAGRLLRAGDVLRQPGLVRALELVADEGPRTFYEGTAAELLLGLMDDRGGLVARDDLLAYRPAWAAPRRCPYAGCSISTRGDLAGVAETLERLPSLRGVPPGPRAVALVGALAPAEANGHTTSVSVADRLGNACVLTHSLGLGSGDFLPGLDVHLNSMLGETELLVGPLRPGERMPSMMAPTVAADGDGLVLAAGSAGGSRLRSALVQVLAGILDEGLSPRAAVERPRLHPTDLLVHAEAGIEEDAVSALEQQGLTVRVWPGLHHYFGGASVVARTGAAADPRRDGLALTLAEPLSNVPAEDRGRVDPL